MPYNKNAKKARSRARHEFVIKLRILRGNRCEACDYDTVPEILEWHHRDPSLKKFSLGSWTGRPFEAVLAEANKCDLLCPTCHRLADRELMKESAA